MATIKNSQPTYFTMALQADMQRIPTAEEIKYNSLKLKKKLKRNYDSESKSTRSVDNSTLMANGVERRSVKRQEKMATPPPVPDSAPPPAPPMAAKDASPKPQYLAVTPGDSGVDLVSPNLSPGADPAVDTIISESTPQVRSDVTRESDKNDEEEYPEAGLARNLLSKFQSLEVQASEMKAKEYRPSGVGSKIEVDRPHMKKRAANVQKIILPPTTTPLRPADGGVIHASYADDGSGDEFDYGAPGGVYESHPVVREDVAREEDRNDEELPPPGLTRNILSTFKQMEMRSGESTPRQQLSRVASSSGIPDLTVGDSYVRENEPVVRSDVAKESDVTNDEELPTHGMAKSLLSMFSQRSDEGRKSLQKQHIPSGVGYKQWRPKQPRPPPAVIKQKQQTPDEVRNVQKQEVVKEEGGVIIEEELPRAGFAKGLLQRFKAMESKSEPNQAVLHQAWVAPKLKESEKPQPSATDDVRSLGEASESSNAVSMEIEVQTKQITEVVEQEYAKQQHHEQTDDLDSNFTETETSESVSEGVLYTYEQPESYEYTKEMVVISKSEAPGKIAYVETSTGAVISKSVATNQRTPDSNAVGSALARFRDIEAAKPVLIEHKVSAVASKATPTPLGRKL